MRFVYVLRVPLNVLTAKVPTPKSNQSCSRTDGVSNGCFLLHGMVVDEGWEEMSSTIWTGFDAVAPLTAGEDDIKDKSGKSALFRKAKANKSTAVPGRSHLNSAGKNEMSENWEHATLDGGRDLGNEIDFRLFLTVK
jgi:hypothetical protein